MALFRYQDIVLNADTSEIPVGFCFFIIDKLFEFPFFLPHIYKLRDEITTGFNCQYMSGFKRKGKAEICQSELLAPCCLIVIANIVLSQRFHVMDIQTKHMAKPVRHEQGMSTGGYCRINITFHQSKLL